MVEITRHHLGSHSGQHDFAIVAKKDGRTLGRLDYALYREIPSVQGIEVVEKRLGIGTALVLSLQEHHPEAAIDFGYLSEEGSLLLASLDWAIVENLKYTEAAEQLAPLERRLTRLEEKAAEVANADAATKAAFVQECADWNDVSDRVDELRRIMETVPPSFRFVKGGKSLKEPAPFTPLLP